MNGKEELRAEWLREIAKGRPNWNFWKSLTPARLQEFIDADAEINAPDSWGFSPIHRVAENNENPTVIKKMIGAGADIHSRAKGSPPLLYAAEKNKNPTVIKALIEAGAKIHEATEKCGNNQSFVGNTALHWAASSNKNVAVIKELIDAGANIHEKNAYGKKAHDLLSRNSVLKDNTEAQELLRGKTTNKTSRDDNDEYATPLRNDEHEIHSRNGLDEEEAKKVIEDWLKKPTPQILRLWGRAGTGKTTFIAKLNFGNIKTRYCAFTGKAASVMRKKGLKGAKTIHGHFYDLVASAPQVKFELRILTSKPDLVIVDECSMVGEKMGQDLLRVAKKILLVGDKNQLPPVEDEYKSVDEAGFFNKSNLDATDLKFTRIHRQKENSPILDFADRAIQGRSITPSDNPNCTVKISSTQSAIDLLHDNGDIIICEDNRRRHELNEQARERLNLTENWLMEDMQIVCSKNNHDLGLMNGTIWTVKEIIEIKEHSDGKDPKDYFTAECILMNDEGKKKIAHLISSTFSADKEDWDTSHFINKRERAVFDYGYAITCHKAQGSEWERVSIYVDKSQKSQMHKFYGKKYYDRWLYTAATRAQKSLYVLFANT